MQGEEFVVDESPSIVYNHKCLHRKLLIHISWIPKGIPAWSEQRHLH